MSLKVYWDTLLRLAQYLGFQGPKMFGQLTDMQFDGQVCPFPRYLKTNEAD